MPTQDTDSREPKSKPRRVLSPWQGIVWWGLPVAIITAVARQDRDYGTSLAGFLSKNFAITLVINLVITGVIGGLIFAWILNRLFSRK